MSFLLAILTCSDTKTAPLGRFDTDMLPDQLIMEAFMSQFNEWTQARFQDANGDFLEVCSWSCVTCTEGPDPKVIKISRFLNSGGSVPVKLNLLPPKLTHIELDGFKCEVAIDFQ